MRLKHSSQLYLVVLLLLCTLPKQSSGKKTTNGGANATSKDSVRPSSSSSSANIQRTKRKLKSALHQSRTAIVPPNELERSSVPVVVEAVLLPRVLPLKGLIRLGCGGWIVLSLFQCVATAGIPHIQTVWGLLYGMDVPMAKHYMPSIADLQLARLIATSTNEILPPITLPSVGALVRLLTSILFFTVTTVLIPRWSTAAQVFLNYRTIGLSPTKKSQRLELSNLLNHPTQAAVLVQILDRHLQHEVAGHEERQKSTVICPIHWIPNHDSATATTTGPTPTPLVAAPTDDERPSAVLLESHFSHPASLFFELNQCRFYFATTEWRCIDGGPLLHAAPIRDLWTIVATGISSTRHTVGQERYAPYNRPTFATPTIAEAFAARLSSPLVVIQLVGRVLSCLEDGLQALLGLVIAAVEHLFNARQAIVSVRQMAKEVKDNVQDTSSLDVRILETSPQGVRSWVSKQAGDLIPGDVFVMTLNGDASVTMPVDALLVAGQTLANEAVLTGESVPQSKVAMDFVERTMHEDKGMCLDLDLDRHSILFAGTTLIHCSNTAHQTQIQNVTIPAHYEESGVICMALRTGTYSSKGHLLRTLKSGSHVGAISNPQSDKDSIRLIMSLSLFAIMSSVSLFVPRTGSTQSTAVPTFRRIIQCTRILIAGIPSDLPLALSAVARSCSQRLREDSDVICSEPGALLTAAYVDTVVFDKTGTITADTQSVSKLVPSLFDSKDQEVERFQLALLAGCHSLIHLDVNSTSETGSRVVGDPLDQAAFDCSGWQYNRTSESYESPQDVTGNATSSEPVRLWQLKCFPFDPSKRLSTAVVVLETAGGSLRMLSCTKGSTDTVRGMYDSKDESDFIQRFDRQVEEFEVQGYRSVALGWKDLSGTDYCNSVFPHGITKDDISAARERASSLHRNDFEVDDLQFGGFVQFDASIRPSSRRIIEELTSGGIRSIMLTGDAVDAAVTVARKVGLIKQNRIAILEEEGDGSKSIHWRIVKQRRSKENSTMTSFSSAAIIPFSNSSLKDLLRKERLGKIALATTGKVLERFFQHDEIAVNAQSFLENLPQVSVIGRATPQQKKLVISHLKEQCHRTVMMCGDGVNDVAAMKTANVAVSFLNGFGDEKCVVEGKDFDDERRRKKVQSQLLGSQRLKKHSERNLKSKEDRERIDQQIEKAQSEVRARAAARKGIDPDSKDVTFDFQDVKDMMSASLRVMKDERKRQQSLRRGGGDAARVLAEERRGDNLSVDGETPTIKPGEASLVAPFSCLHPSIDGVDAVLRASIGTAASALATQELISLHSLMACANMASLYREGVRYGKQMMMVENMLYMLVDQQRYQVSRIPRPRLPSSPSIRPPFSMFQPSAILRTVVQAILNLITMNAAVGYAKDLEHKSSNKILFQLQLGGDRPRKMSQVMTAMAIAAGKDPQEGESVTSSVFRRPPFRPNYETNVIFVFSVLQNILISLTNHRGYPFSRGVFESEAFSSFALGSIGFCILCVAEASPRLNSVLQLKSLPSRKSRCVFLALVVFNVVASLGANWFFLGRQGPCDRQSTKSSKRFLAADLEEQLLKEEFDRNLRRCLMGLGLIGYFSISALM